MNHKNVIEINGKKYDPKSGVLLSARAPLSSKQIDGIIKPARKSINKVHTTARTPRERSPVHSSHAKTSKASSNPRKKRTVQKSHTLMRSGVAKPSTQPKSVHSIHTFTRSHNNAGIKKSDYVHKYTHRLQPPKIERKETKLQVTPPPLQPTTTTIKHSDSKSAQTRSNKDSSAEQLLHKALAEAPTTRKKHLKRQRTHKLGKLATVGVSAVLLIGFILYMNYGQIQMQLASSKAGFTVSSPSYVAAGYSLNQSIQAEPGSVTLSFNSNTDNRRYNLIQEASGWNSASLQENFLKAQNVGYHPASEAGRTIFIYDETNATWVSGGVWYNLTSESLSSEQLVKIATSL